jgi:hypothetical protein
MSATRLLAKHPMFVAGVHRDAAVFGLLNPDQSDASEILSDVNHRDSAPAARQSLSLGGHLRLLVAELQPVVVQAKLPDRHHLWPHHTPAAS